MINRAFDGMFIWIITFGYILEHEKEWRQEIAKKDEEKKKQTNKQRKERKKERKNNNKHTNKQASKISYMFNKFVTILFFTVTRPMFEKTGHEDNSKKVCVWVCLTHSLKHLHTHTHTHKHTLTHTLESTQSQSESKKNSCCIQWRSRAEKSLIILFYCIRKIIRTLPFEH